MALDPEVWGPFYWFVLHTIALSYPTHPNETIKKKYYDFLQNMPLFLPISTMGNKFSELLDKYPVTPYLDSQPSFVKWVHFIHNKINAQLGKDELTFTEALDAYYELYKPKEIILREQLKYRKKLLFGGVIIILIICGYYLYKK